MTRPSQTADALRRQQALRDIEQAAQSASAGVTDRVGDVVGLARGRDVPRGGLRVCLADDPRSAVTFRQVGPPPSWAADGFGGHETVPLVTGRPTSRYTEPDANKLMCPALLIEGVRTRRNVEGDVALIERWAALGERLLVAGAVPAGALHMTFVVPRAGLTPSADPKRQWWAAGPAGDYRIRQGYDLVLMEVADPDEQQRPAARARMTAARPKDVAAARKAGTDVGRAVRAARRAARAGS